MKVANHLSFGEFVEVPERDGMFGLNCSSDSQGWLGGGANLFRLRCSPAARRQVGPGEKCRGEGAHRDGLPPSSE